MLSLDTCKRLKDAGFPQYGIRLWWIDCGEKHGWKTIDMDEAKTKRLDGYFTHSANDGNNPVAVSCPNSDELIAYIWKRWQLYISLSQSLDGYFGAYAKNTTGNIVASSGSVVFAVEALAELYIALSKEE